MNPPLRIDITDDAALHVTAATEWWSKNRSATPGAVLEDLDRMLGLLCVQPDLGTRTRRTKLPGVRRVTLLRIRYYLYYRVTKDGLQVLALWHTSRGQGPSI